MRKIQTTLFITKPLNNLEQRRENQKEKQLPEQCKKKKKEKNNANSGDSGDTQSIKYIKFNLLKHYPPSVLVR